jgi:hypothetical protein
MVVVLGAMPAEGAPVDLQAVAAARLRLIALGDQIAAMERDAPGLGIGELADLIQPALDVLRVLETGDLDEAMALLADLL